jgi:hypothetical protein
MKIELHEGFCQIYTLLHEMKHIVLLSDTHGYLDQRLFKHMESADEIWHAGDIGSIDVADRLVSIKPLRAVHGNIDNHVVRMQYPTDQRFTLENVEVWIRHIGGYPGHYEKKVREILMVNPPGLFIAGHSHILKVQYDKQFNLLYLNPGAAGNNGFHAVQTMLKFTLQMGQVLDMQVVEWKRS